MSMAHSIEARVPLLDHELLEFAATIPPELRLRRGSGKYIFKQALRGVLPDETLDRSKRGFAVPLARWLRGPLGGFVRELLLSQRARQRGVFNPAYVEKLLRRQPGGPAARSPSLDAHVLRAVGAAISRRAPPDRGARLPGAAGPGSAGGGDGVRMNGARIAVVAPTLEILGGQGVQARALVDGLRSDGWDVRLIPINPSFPPGLRWIRRRRYLRTILNQVLYLPGLYRLVRADIVHVFSASYWSFLLAPAPALLAARLLGKRVVLHYHSGEADDHLGRWGRLVHPWLRLAHEIVVPSDYLRARVRPTRVHARAWSPTWSTPPYSATAHGGPCDRACSPRATSRRTTAWGTRSTPLRSCAGGTPRRP